MGYSARNGKLGFECDVCGVFVGDIRIIKSCDRCHKDICPPHARLTSKPASLRPQFRPSRWGDRVCYVCPDCDEERQREKLNDKAEEESEPAQPITTCQRCGANDEPPDMKTFGYRAPHFSNRPRPARSRGYQEEVGGLVSAGDPLKIILIPKALSRQAKPFYAINRQGRPIAR